MKKNTKYERINTVKPQIKKKYIPIHFYTDFFLRIYYSTSRISLL